MRANEYNDVNTLSFSGRHVRARVVRQARDFKVEGRTMVVNLDTTPVLVAEDPRKGVPALSSTVLVDSEIEYADTVLLLGVDEDAPAGDIVAEPGWRHLTDVLAEGAPEGWTGVAFPREVPLFRSPADELGVVRFDPAAVLGQPGREPSSRDFRVRLNLWFAPAGTDCLIHNRHDFIEIHSQVYGLGRMQKFRSDDHATLYEDLPLSPGYTTPMPFCVMDDEDGFVYPWHQYRADTDCVWLAVEYHPVR